MKHNKIIKNGKASLVIIAFLSNATVSFAAPSDELVTSGNATDGKNTKIVYTNARVRTNTSDEVNTKDDITARANTRDRTNTSDEVNIKDNNKVQVNSRTRDNTTNLN